MNYWVCKLEPDVRSDVARGKTARYGNRKIPPKNLNSGDRLFLWESSPSLRIVGLGAVTQPRAGESKGGRHLFALQYLTDYFVHPLGIKELRNIPLITGAAFLRGGATGLIPVLLEQAELLFGVLRARNARIGLEQVWTDLEPNEPETWLSFEPPAREGLRKLVAHYARERNRRIIAEKRRTVLDATGKLECEVCGFDFEFTYGPLGKGFCEVHHKLPLGQAEKEVETNLEDLAIVCSNCHRIIHRDEPPIEITELRRSLHRP